MGGEYRYIGKPMARRDAEDIVTGTVQYSDDRQVSEPSLRESVAEPLRPRGDQEDRQRARPRPCQGVKAVVTWEDIPDYRGRHSQERPRSRQEGPVRGRRGGPRCRRTEEIAEEALDLIEVRIRGPAGGLRHRFCPASRARPRSVTNTPTTYCRAVPSSTDQNCLKGVVRGDVDKGFAEADVITEGTFGYENIPNAMPPESVGAVATLKNRTRRLSRGPARRPIMDKVTLFHVFNRQLEIRSIGSPCGGGFGTKFTCWQVQSYAILLAKATGFR